MSEASRSLFASICMLVGHDPEDTGRSFFFIELLPPVYLARQRQPCVEFSRLDRYFERSGLVYW